MRLMLDKQLNEIREESYVISLIIGNEYNNKFDNYTDAMNEVLNSMDDYFDMYEFAYCDTSGEIIELEYRGDYIESGFYKLDKGDSVEYFETEWGAVQAFLDDLRERVTIDIDSLVHYIGKHYKGRTRRVIRMLNNLNDLLWGLDLINEVDTSKDVNHIGLQALLDGYGTIIEKGD